MVTNQDGLGSERYPQAHFEQVHDFVLHLFRSQGIELRCRYSSVRICAHEQCECRKPRTGLVDRYLQRQPIDPQRSAMIGDRDTDLRIRAQPRHPRAARARAERGRPSLAEDWAAVTRALLARRATSARKTRETDIEVRNRTRQ